MSTEKVNKAEEPIPSVNPNSANNPEIAPKPKGMFGISTETKSSNLSPIIPTESEPITMGFLQNVEYILRGVKGEEKPIIQFTFTDASRKRSHQHTEWAVDAYTDDEDKEKKMGWLNSRIKHIYEAFAKFPDAGIGMNAESWEEYFQQIVDAFNKDGENNSPIYTNVAIWIKIVVSKKQAKKGFQLPFAPNFIERVTRDGAGNVHRTLLTINHQYETLKIKMEEASSGGVNAGTGYADLGQAAPEFPTIGS